MESHMDGTYHHDAPLNAKRALLRRPSYRIEVIALVHYDHALGEVRAAHHVEAGGQ